MNESLAVILPVFNDWASFSALVKDLDQAALQCQRSLIILVVDDGSTEPPPTDLNAIGPLRATLNIELIQLALNLGHQRALAIGLCAALDSADVQQFIVMDADGEDRPQDIPRLLQAARRHPDAINVAKRRRRNETLLFRSFYRGYKSAFYLLTGKSINFGNFCLLSREHLIRLTMIPELWNNLPAAVTRSRLPIHPVAIDRGHRYSGSSKMNFVSLSLHGMSAYSVYTDAILVRLLIATFCIAGLGVLLILFVVALRLFTNLATPGWGTTVFFGTAIIVSQITFTTLMSALLLLSNRSQRLVIPVVEAKAYIRQRRLISFQSEIAQHA